MSIRREYTGDFTPEETYLKNLSDHLEEELKAIKEIKDPVERLNRLNQSSNKKKK